MSAKEYRSPEIRVTLKAMGGEVVGHIHHIAWSQPDADNVAHQVFWIRVTGVPASSIPDAMNAMETDHLLPVVASSIESIKAEQS